LINEPGNQRELIVGVDDDQITYGGEGSPRTIPRDDVARVMMEVNPVSRNLDAYGNGTDPLTCVPTYRPKEMTLV